MPLPILEETRAASQVPAETSAPLASSAKGSIRALLGLLEHSLPPGNGACLSCPVTSEHFDGAFHATCKQHGRLHWGLGCFLCSPFFKGGTEEAVHGSNCSDDDITTITSWSGMGGCGKVHTEKAQKSLGSSLETVIISVGNGILVLFFLCYKVFKGGH